MARTILPIFLKTQRAVHKHTPVEKHQSNYITHGTVSVTKFVTEDLTSTTSKHPKRIAKGFWTGKYLPQKVLNRI